MQPQPLQYAKRNWGNNQQILVLLASLLIMMWIFTVGNKLIEFPKFRIQMLAQPLPQWINQILVYLLLPIELLCVPLLYFNRTRFLGFMLSFLLMLSFTIYIAWMLAFHEHLPCACGGPIPKWGWGQHLAFNIIFTLIAFIGLWTTYKSTRAREHTN
ncbi:MauE/DoxX family redox-associated membrane protein [Pedobacter sp. ASV28]|uniref:MauE/DoxX family redox-associated membrane protein n=1 Tax=Pedobacter sp. ASV28 TaxID=2795123 RepID=UPI0018ECE15A|nr:MauE/DoxX family redox-associated membrane protein [Pedobacter sp. ASV28]